MEVCREAACLGLSEILSSMHGEFGVPFSFLFISLWRKREMGRLHISTDPSWWRKLTLHERTVPIVSF